MRVWRGLRLNEKYAAKLARKAARNKELEEQKAAVAVPPVKTNPFSVGVNFVANYHHSSSSSLAVTLLPTRSAWALIYLVQLLLSRRPLLNKQMKMNRDLPLPQHHHQRMKMTT